MEIYVVQQGDTITSIADKYGVTADKIIQDNGIQKPYRLAVGQTLVIAFPKQIYVVKEGDTLDGIADSFHINVLQILRNNPELAKRQYIYPGETLVISYDTSEKILVAGYTYPFINNDTLKMTLPNLTYLPVFNYQLTASGAITGADTDIAVIDTAYLYSTAPTLVATAFSSIGEIDLEIVSEFLLSREAQENFINYLLTVLKAKGYYGVNLAFQFINESNQDLYLNHLIRVSNSLHQAGYPVFLTINPGLRYNGSEVIFEKINYSAFSNNCDGILFLSYDWGSISRPPIQFSIVTTSSFLDYITAQVPPTKIRIALPTLGYDWQLPYEEGKTKANALNFNSVLALANEVNAVINYDENTLSAYFNYNDKDDLPHIVWFKDARSIDGSLKILKSYGIDGIGIWNIMNYFEQMWLVIITQCDIEKIL